MYFYPPPFQVPFQQQQLRSIPLDLVLDFEQKLYIGCVQGLANYQNYDIKAIITLCPELNANIDENVDQLMINVNDRPNTDISKYFKETNKFIVKHLSKNNNILVHCAAGKSRSATIVLAYLIYSQNWSLEQSLVYLKSVRPIVSPNPGFIRQLLKYEQEILGEIRSNLNYTHTPYYNVQNPETEIPDMKNQNNQLQTAQQPLGIANNYDTSRRNSFMNQAIVTCRPQNGPYLQENMYLYSTAFAQRYY